MLNDEEKRELILAHAAARAHEPREWGIGYAVGLLATILIVVTGWVLTFERNLRVQLPTTQDSLVSGTKERVETILQNAPTPKQVTDSVEAQRRAYEAAIKAARVSQAASSTVPALTTDH